MAPSFLFPFVQAAKGKRPDRVSAHFIIQCSLFDIRYLLFDFPSPFESLCLRGPFFPLSIVQAAKGKRPDRVSAHFIIQCSLFDIRYLLFDFPSPFESLCLRGPFFPLSIRSGRQKTSVPTGLLTVNCEPRTNKLRCILIFKFSNFHISIS